jgi:hypothetical protein
MRAHIFLPPVLSALIVAAGCQALAPRTVRIDTTVGMYQTAQLSYRIDTGKTSEPVKVANIAGQQVSYQQKPSGPYPGHSVVQLAVMYPHPGGHPGYALAEVVVKARKPPATTPPADKPAWRQFTDGIHEILTQNNLPGIKLADGVYEAWALDIPRSDVDGLVGRLGETGFFHLAGNSAPGIDVTCVINGQTIEKQWGHVSELDTLIERVRNEGTLVSYTHPLEDEKPKPTAQPVRFAAWPPAGAAPIGTAVPAANVARGDWVANQAGVPVPQPGLAQDVPPNGPQPPVYAAYPSPAANGYPQMAQRPGGAAGQGSPGSQAGGYGPAASQYPAQAPNPTQGGAGPYLDQGQIAPQGASQYSPRAPAQYPKGPSPYATQGQGTYQAQGPYSPSAPINGPMGGQTDAPAQPSAPMQPTAAQPTSAQGPYATPQPVAAQTAPGALPQPPANTVPPSGTSQSGMGGASSGSASSPSTKSNSRWSLFGSGNKLWTW